MPTNKEIIVNTWREKGWTNSQIAAGLGNLQQESNFNPNALNVGEQAVGLAQWRGSRLENLQNYAAERGQDYKDVATQAAFVDYEMKSGSETAAGAKFFGASDQSPSNLAAVFDKSYERSAGTERDQRMANANAFAQGDNLDNPNFKPGSTGPANSLNGGLNIPGGAAAGAGGGGGGAGCAGGMLGAIAGMAMAGMMGGLGLGSVFSGVSGALNSVTGGLTGAIGGALGNIGGALSSVTGALGNIGGALSGALGNITGALGALPGVGQLGNIASGLTGALGAVTGGITSALGGVTNLVTGGLNSVLGQVSSIGANILPGLGNVISGTIAGGLNQLVSPLTSVLQNPLNIVGVAQQFSAAGGLKGFVTQVAGNMAGNFVGGTIQNFVNNIGIANGLAGVSRNLVGGISEAMGQSFGSGVGGLGALVRNMDGMATFGMSALGNNLPALGADMINMGGFATTNLTRLMQPGNVAAQIVAAGLGESTGILSRLTDAGIPIGGIDDPRYDSQIKYILNTIDTPSAISLVTKYFGVGVPLNNLGNLTDINHMMKNTAATLPVSNFQDFGKTLIQAQVTEAQNFVHMGDAFLKLESTRNLNHISQLDTPIHKPSGDLILKTFGYGSGTFGEHTMADVMGTAAGYVHEDTFPVIVANVNWLHTQSAATQYFKGVDFLEGLISGKYTTATDDTLGNISYTYTVPYNESGYTNGFIGTFSDSATYNVVSGPSSVGNVTGTGLVEAVAAVRAYIEAGMLTLKNSTDPKIQAAIQKIDTAHNASVCQVLREATILKLHDINIFQPAKMTPLNAYAFAMSLQDFAGMTGHGQMADYLERVAQDNLYGDCIKAAMRQARNAKVLQELGVNVERFNLPASQYYRDPLGFANNLYRGVTVDTSAYVTNIYYPADPTDQYIMNRDAKLADNGYSEMVLLPAEKDELYYDLLWLDNTEVAKQIGTHAVEAAVRRNLKIFGNKIEIIDLNRTRYRIGILQPNGIEEYDPETLLAVLFSIVNKILYGNIGVTKNNNPFSTEEIIYGVAELLGELNAANVDFLSNTYLGSEVLGIFLTRVANKYKSISTLYDTRLSRNDPTVYGGQGPGYNIRSTNNTSI